MVKKNAAKTEDEKTHRLLGLEDECCPFCGAHLKLVGKPSWEGGDGQPICLNACHLGKAGQARFNATMRAAMTPRDSQSAR